MSGSVKLVKVDASVVSPSMRDGIMCVNSSDWRLPNLVICAKLALGLSLCLPPKTLSRVNFSAGVIATRWSKFSESARGNSESPKSSNFRNAVKNFMSGGR